MKRKNLLKLKNFFFKNFFKIRGVKSVNLVGSFWGKNSNKNYKDIDIVVIVDKLTKDKFKKCKNLVNKVNPQNYGLNNHKVFINDTFGPLKFDFNKYLIFHLMVYDYEGHFNHVIKSPFTCFDWERNKLFKGKNLKKIFPVTTLQYNDFYNSRRGTEEYLKELSKNYISYRRYNFKKGKIILTTRKYQINKFEKKEFYFHIVKNLIFNYHKLITQKNVLPNKKQYTTILKKIFKKNKFLIDNFNLVLKVKKTNIELNNNFFNNWIKKFVNIFQKYLNNEEKFLKKIIFLRHAKTNLNDKTFLGVGRNPSITLNKKFFKKIKLLNQENTNVIFSSSLKRSIQTAQSLKNKKIILNNLLNEKNYGLAEGLNYKQLAKKFPKIIKSWKSGKDPIFPRGESDRQVYNRLKRFKRYISNYLKKNKSQKNITVVTHNVILRCLIGSEFKVLPNKWHKINVNHLDKIEFVYFKGKILPNFNRRQFLQGVF